MQSLDEWTATAAEQGPSLAYYLQMCSMTDVDDPELVRLVDAGAPASKVKRLILEGADVNATSNWGYTALYPAVLNNDVELVRLLLRHGARADYIDDDGDNLLVCAITAEICNPAVVAELLCVLPIDQRTIHIAELELRWAKPKQRLARREVLSMMLCIEFDRKLDRAYDRLKFIR
jgi:ankyrin repeat protein